MDENKNNKGAEANESVPASSGVPPTATAPVHSVVTPPPAPPISPADVQGAPRAPEPAPVGQSLGITPDENGNVVISAEALNALMTRMTKLEESSNLMLQVQDKNKIRQIEELRRSGKLVKSVKIRKYAGKYILGWRTVEDEVYKDEQGRIVERQTVELFFEDGSKHTMSMRQWAGAPEYVPFEVTKESRDQDGNLFFTCVGPDGKTFEVNAAFIN